MAIERISMNYFEVYDLLYQQGYHAGGKNHGVSYIDPIVANYQFNSVLDVGCSQGKAVKKFLSHGKEARGIDVSSHAIGQSIHYVGEDVCRVGSVTDIKFGDNSFDAVFSCDVLEHLKEEDIGAAVAEIKRVSRKYLFLQIAFGREKITKWAEMLNREYPSLYSGENLHLTVMSEAWWIEKIEDDSWAFLGSNPHGVLIFEHTSTG